MSPWGYLPSHLHGVAFRLSRAQLIADSAASCAWGDVLCDFPYVLSTIKVGSGLLCLSSRSKSFISSGQRLGHFVPVRTEPTPIRPPPNSTNARPPTLSNGRPLPTPAPRWRLERNMGAFEERPITRSSIILPSSDNFSFSRRIGYRFSWKYAHLLPRF